MHGITFAVPYFQVATDIYIYIYRYVAIKMFYLQSLNDVDST